MRGVDGDRTARAPLLRRCRPWTPTGPVRRPGAHAAVSRGPLGGATPGLAPCFDHTCLINADDPELALFRQLHARGILDLRVLPHVSMEGSARFVWAWADALVRAATGGRAWCYAVEARENDKNAAVWEVARDGSQPAPPWVEPPPQG